MRLLVLGGTEFAGRAVVESALARGWDTTVFNRGRHAPPPGVTALRGDRTEPGGLDALRSPESGEWDVVVDTWSLAPRAVRDTARLLAGRAGRYVYVSSCSVYAWPMAAGTDETGPVVEGSPDDEDVPYAETKRGGELAAIDAFGDEGSLLLRAGLIIGPWENIGRLPWWLGRIARGGPVLAPGPRDSPIQYIDVRDLADWALSAAEAGLGGAYNMVSEPGHTTMEELLTACLRVTGSAAELRWTPPDVIMAAGVEPWTELPVWVPPVEAAELHNGVYRLDVAKAMGAGLRCRPIGETVADTWSWLQSIGGTPPPRPNRPGRSKAPGLSPEVEAKLLAL
ncbi:SDR family oxidoreductase [Streptomyces sp. NPDC055078]